MKICGIYKITSPSGRIYVGQSVDIKSRWKAYKRGCIKSQTLLKRSFDKYGYGNHKFEIVIECSKKELNDLEQYYIKLYNSFDSKAGLNLKAGGQSGGINCEEVIKKLRKPKSEEHRQNLSKAKKGTKLPNSKRAQIIKLFKEGKSVDEIIALGYKRITVLNNTFKFRKEEKTCAKIVALFNSGKTIDEIVEMGYNRTTVIIQTRPYRNKMLRGLNFHK